MPIPERTQKQANKNFRGLTLIELLVGITLTGSVLVLLFQSYCFLETRYIEYRHRLTSLDMAGVAYSYLWKDLQSSGYRGCRTQDPHYPIYTHFLSLHSHYRYSRLDKALLNISSSACCGTLPDTLCQRLKPNSSVLIIYNIPRQETRLKERMKTVRCLITTQAPHPIQTGKMVLISDALGADCFISGAVSSHSIDHPPLSKTYGPGSEIIVLETTVYYLALPERYLQLPAQQSTAARYSLFRHDFSGRAQEILSDIRAFEIQLEEANHQTISVHFKLVLQNNEEIQYAIPLGNRYRTFSGLDIFSRHFAVSTTAPSPDPIGC